MDFARDLGYLDKFLVSLRTHADTLPPAQGARLKALMAEETARWAEIKGLLAGQPVAPASAAPAAPAAPVAPVAPAASVVAAVSVAPTGLTVGSLLGVPKK